jgi:hypothetical protein
MIMNLLVVNLQSFGDILLSTHIATLAKRYVPDWKVHFAFRKELTLTTAETNPAATKDMIDILSEQPYAASVGLVENGMYVGPLSSIPDKTIIIQGWSSELGIVKSQLKPFYDLFGITDSINTETQFAIKNSGLTSYDLVVGLAGDLDFIRKWGNEEEYKKFLAYVSSDYYNIKIEKFGVDTTKESYYKQLQRLSYCDLVIAPMGSLIHAAAGFGVDTIALTSIFPSKYDAPEYYHSGWHKSIKVDTNSQFHCGSFACITYKPEDSQQSWGNPRTQFDFWSKDCPYTNNKKSCVYNTPAQLIINEFREWYDRNN